MTVYTGRGDEGRTDLWGGTRVSKRHPRIESYGTVDELNALIGTVRPTDHDDVNDRLERIQHHLHVIQAELANPDGDGPQIEETHVESLETWVDGIEAELDPLESFILPGGGHGGGALHHARTVCRRAERRVVALADGESVSPVLLTYLNRLSDLLFVLARVVNEREGIPEQRPEY